MRKKFNILFVFAVLGFMFSVVPAKAETKTFTNITIPKAQATVTYSASRTNSSNVLAVVATSWTRAVQARIWQDVHPTNKTDSWHNLILNGSYNWGTPQSNFSLPSLYLRAKSFSNSAGTMSGKWYY